MILHLVQSSPNQSSALKDCLAMMSKQDTIVLMGPGIYALASANEQIAQLVQSRRLFAIDEDLVARSISNEQGASCSISYLKMVDLTLQADKTMTW